MDSNKNGYIRIITETSTSLVGLSVFSRWDFEVSSPEMLAAVATTKGIELYKFVNGQITKANDGWPLQYKIKAIQYCHIRSSTKLIVVPTDAGLPVNIYNIAINKTTQFW